MNIYEQNFALVDIELRWLLVVSTAKVVKDTRLAIKLVEKARANDAIEILRFDIISIEYVSSYHFSNKILMKIQIN